MTERSRPASLGRLLLWRARINRLQFLALYVGLCVVSGLVGAGGLAIVAAVAGEQAMFAVFENPLWALPFFLPLLYLAATVVVARTHDLGWSAWIPILLYAGALIPFALIVPTMGFWPALDVHLSEPMWNVSLAAIFVCSALFQLYLLILALRRGQHESNRYGAVPGAGLWGDLAS